MWAHAPSAQLQNPFLKDIFLFTLRHNKLEGRKAAQGELLLFIESYHTQCCSWPARWDLSQRVHSCIGNSNFWNTVVTVTRPPPDHGAAIAWLLTTPTLFRLVSVSNQKCSTEVKTASCAAPTNPVNMPPRSKSTRSKGSKVPKKEEVEFIDSGDDSEFGLSKPKKLHKSPKKPTKSSETAQAPWQRPRGRGKLKMLPEMPLDILFEVRSNAQHSTFLYHQHLSDFQSHYPSRCLAPIEDYKGPPSYSNISDIGHSLEGCFWVGTWGASCPEGPERAPMGELGFFQALSCESSVPTLFRIEMTFHAF